MACYSLMDSLESTGQQSENRVRKWSNWAVRWAEFCSDYFLIFIIHKSNILWWFEWEMSLYRLRYLNARSPAGGTALLEKACHCFVFLIKMWSLSFLSRLLAAKLFSSFLSFLFFWYLYLILFHVYECLPECVYVWILHVCLVSMETRRFQTPGTGVMDNWESLCEWKEQNPGPLRGQVFSATEPLLQGHHSTISLYKNILSKKTNEQQRQQENNQHPNQWHV